MKGFLKIPGKIFQGKIKNITVLSLAYVVIPILPPLTKKKKIKKIFT